MIDITFDGLFSIELLHKYFTDGLCPDFTMTPSEKTLSVVNGHKMVVKQYHNKLYAGIQSKAGNPFIPVEAGMQMTFYLWLNNPFFYNYTDLPGSFDAGKIFYFTNRNNNVANGKNILSAAITAYSNTVTYAPGDLALGAMNVVYMATRTNGPGSLHAVTDTGYWAPTDNNSYAYQNDVLQFMPSISAYNFTLNQSAAVISVSGYNSPIGDYSLPVLTKTITFANPVPSFKLDLSSLVPGKYSLTVNGVQQWIYINDELINNRPFGVIDIYNSATPASCNLVTGAGTLVSPPYTIWFLNRATVWKYVLPAGQTGLIVDNASIYNFATTTNNITSTAPIPLTDALLNFKLTIGGNAIHPIPCADAQRLTRLTQAGDTYACSEIYINQ